MIITNSQSICQENGWINVIFKYSIMIYNNKKNTIPTLGYPLEINLCCMLLSYCLKYRSFIMISPPSIGGIILTVFSVIWELYNLFPLLDYVLDLVLAYLLHQAIKYSVWNLVRTRPVHNEHINYHIIWHSNFASNFPSFFFFLSKI